MAYPVELTNHVVSLREFTSEDVDAATEIVGDARVTDFLSFDPRTRTETATMIDGVIDRAKNQPRSEYYLAITTNNDGLVGFARLGLAGVHAAKLGYAIAYRHQRRGYATAAINAVIEYGFIQLGLHRITAAIGPDNLPSIDMIKQFGFIQEGRLRDHVYTNHAWRVGGVGLRDDHNGIPVKGDHGDNWTGTAGRDDHGCDSQQDSPGGALGVLSWECARFVGLGVVVV